MGYVVYLSFLIILLLFFAVSLSSASYAESQITCVSCIQIPSYEIDLYKEMFPLTVWTDSQIYDHYSTIKVNGHLKPENSIAPILGVVTNPVGNIVTIQQLSPDVNGNFSFELNTHSPLWTQNGNYILKVQSGSVTRQFKTTFTLVPSLIGSVDKCTFEEISVLANNERIYCIPFKITNGVITNTEGKLNSDTNEIILSMSGHDVKSVIFDIPRYVLDSQSSTNTDSVFTVMSNDKMTEYQEVESDSDSRQIKLDYPNTTKTTFAIIGTHAIPEFGSISILILVVTIMSILLIGKSFSNRFVKF